LDIIGNPNPSYLIRFIVSCTLVLLGTQVFAQNLGLHIARTQSRITLDGEMNEPDWANAEVASNFMQVFPFDSSYAFAQTEVRMLYDNQFVCIFARMKNLGPRKYVTQSLRRDYDGQTNDGFSIVIDTYKDKTNGFYFGINPFGVQREGLIVNGGATSDDLTLTWDNKWYSQSKILDDSWVTEIAIPFKTIRFKHGLDSWNINFFRTDSKYTERSAWTPIPRVYQLFSLAFVQELIWDKPLEKPGGNVSIIPYTAAKVGQNFEDGTPTEKRFAVGGDAKIGLGPALNLDLTVNPDYSQVEVDQQVTNLSRFEILYPEKRQFFLENADLFGNFGYSNARPFFSRRIGVTRSKTTGQNIQNPIYGGLRLSGKIDNKTRIGVMSLQAAPVDSINQPTTNYTVAAIQRRVFSRSSVGLILINKQAFHDSTSTEFTALPNKYSRLIGLDYNLATKDNKWNGKFFYHRSFDEFKRDNAYATTANIGYKVPNFEASFLAQDFGNNYNPEVGYAPRVGYSRIAPEAYYYWYPKSKVVNNHGPGFDIDILGNRKYGFTDWDANLWYNITFQSTASGFVRIREDYTYLYFDFDPTNTGGIPLATGTGYHYKSVILYFESNSRKKFYFNVTPRIGQYYNGHRIASDATVNYRLQPYAVLSMNVSYNHIVLPSPHASADLVLISPKFDLTFSRKVFWSTYLQYNSQIHNFNINSRLQWRFKPVSDLYLVYTDNYFADTFHDGDILYLGQPKLRAVVLKLTYWFNL
jgi:hypothetical protein